MGKLRRGARGHAGDSARADGPQRAPQDTLSPQPHPGSRADAGLQQPGRAGGSPFRDRDAEAAEGPELPAAHSAAERGAPGCRGRGSVTARPGTGVGRLRDRGAPRVAPRSLQTHRRPSGARAWRDGRLRSCPAARREGPRCPFVRAPAPAWRGPHAGNAQVSRGSRRRRPAPRSGGNISRGGDGDAGRWQPGEEGGGSADRELGAGALRAAN